MGSEVDIPWVGCQYTMGRGFDMPWVEVDIPWVGGRKIMCMGVDI